MNTFVDVMAIIGAIVLVVGTVIGLFALMLSTAPPGDMP